MEHLDILRQLQLPSVAQLRFVVRDVVTAMPCYSALYGVRTWYETDLSGTTFEYKGKPIMQHIRAMLGFLGRTQIELLSSFDQTPSLYTDFLAEYGEGFQHVACDVADLLSKLVAAVQLGIEPIYQSWFSSSGGIKAACAYLDLRPFGWVVVELVVGRWHGWPVKNTPFSLQLGAWLEQVKAIKA